SSATCWSLGRREKNCIERLASWLRASGSIFWWALGRFPSTRSPPSGRCVRTRLVSPSIRSPRIPRRSRPSCEHGSRAVRVRRSCSRAAGGSSSSACSRRSSTPRPELERRGGRWPERGAPALGRCSGRQLARAVVRKGTLDLFARVHHEGSVASDGLSDRLAGEEQEAAGVGPLGDGSAKGIAFREHGDLTALDRPRLGAFAELDDAFEDVDEGVVLRRERERASLVTGEAHVEHQRLGRYTTDWTFEHLAAWRRVAAGDDLDAIAPPFELRGRDLGG